MAAADAPKERKTRLTMKVNLNGSTVFLCLPSQNKELITRLRDQGAVWWKRGIFL